jgi:glycosyltransferase involved in cell wall biosynthesis
MDWTSKNLGVLSISLLPNFISAEHEPSTKASQKNILLFIGTLTEQKGVDVLIKAIAKVRDIIPDVRLKIIGDGPEEPKLKKLSEHLHMVDHIAFAGKMSYQQVMREYDDALCVVIPSKYVENCSLVGIEALSKGRSLLPAGSGGFLTL